MARANCPNESVNCKYFDTRGGCFSDVHHLFYPRAEYRTPTEKQFRELDQNKVQICRQEHDTAHALFDDPIKPSLDVMRFAIEQTRELRRGGIEDGQIDVRNAY